MKGVRESVDRNDLFSGSVFFDSSPGFLRGTELLTPEGSVPVEALAVGDLVMVWGTLMWNRAQPHGRGTSASVRRIERIVLPTTPETAPICFPDGVFREDAPWNPLYVLKGQRLFTKRGVGVRAERYLGWQGVAQDFSEPTVEYYRITFDEHCVIVAEGVLAESYLDLEGPRRLFQI
jgi:hypothetical protein